MNEEQFTTSHADQQPGKYEEAMAQLEAIVRKMESGELDIDEIAAQLKTAQRLIKFCKDKLTKTEAELLEEQAKGE
jgi:exodeoxyribonuclease VII small subunit